jgi:hypothetical protein
MFTLFSKKSMVDTTALKRIKAMQLQAGKSWKGMNVEHIGRPGFYSQAPTNKKFTDLIEYQKLEDERFRYFLDAINKFRELEEEKLIQDMNYNKQAKDSGV